MRTQNPTEFAISGGGFFVVRAASNNTFFATRNGAFQWDESGFLITSNGLRLQGFCDSTLTVKGDIRIIEYAGYRPGTNPEPVTLCYADTLGKLHFRLPDGTETIRGQILLQDFRNSPVLKEVSPHLYANVEAAMPVFAAGGVPGYQGLGRIESGALEGLGLYLLPALQIPRLSGFRLLLTDAITIETSQDLVHWTTLGETEESYTDGTGFLDIPEDQAVNRFFRTRREYPY